MRVLVTGATGYVGGRLVPRLIERGHQVRILVRDPRRAGDRPWADQVEIVRGDLLDRESLAEAFANVDSAYYLVHGMGGGADFEERDRQAARHFVDAGRNLTHCVYLGGLLPTPEEGRREALSQHLASRAEVGEILREGLPTTEFRAGPIIGSGSASFEMVRYLTERLPVMVAPSWTRNFVQPIGIRDALDYLLDALNVGPSGVVEIGAEPLRFIDMMYQFAEARGMRRWILPVPVLAPGLAARWIGLVTPIPNKLAVPLVKGLIRSLYADTSRARELFPRIEPMSYRTAVGLALERTRSAEIETRWSNALADFPDYELTDWEGLIRERRVVDCSADVEDLYRVASSLGGDRGWLVWGWAWEIRGLVDRLIGGPGLRRGRRHPEELLPGEALDFWRVEVADPPKRLRLRAEMKVPGRAWLDFETIPSESGSRLIQTALFVPRGLFGALYWYLLYPLHALIFSDMARAIARAAERSKSETSVADPERERT